MAKKGQIQKRYSTEFKIGVITDMREHRLGYRETARKYGLSVSGSTVDLLKRRKRVFLEEDLIAENQRLRMEIKYLKKLSALVLAEEQRQIRLQKNL